MSLMVREACLPPSGRYISRASQRHIGGSFRPGAGYRPGSRSDSSEWPARGGQFFFFPFSCGSWLGPVWSDCCSACAYPVCSSTRTDMKRSRERSGSGKKS